MTHLNVHRAVLKLCMNGKMLWTVRPRPDIQ